MAKNKTDFSEAIMAAASQVAQTVRARAVFAYLAAMDDVGALQKALKSPTKLIVCCRNAQEQARAQEAGLENLLVPAFDLTRMGQIKIATLIAFSQGLLETGDVFVFISGLTGRGIDTVVTMRVGQEYELFQTVGQPKLTEHIRRPVFEKVLRVALELAHEGREGKPVGALFVVGDHREVEKMSQPGRINPFHGYTEKERNVLDDALSDTIKEIAKLDGAFILKGNGVIVEACATLRPAMAGERLPQGTGARHAAAAAITASTKSIAVTLSESTGDVRVWRRGEMITEIEKAPPSLVDSTTPPNVSNSR